MAQLAGRLATGVPRLAKASADFAVPKLQTFWKYARVEMKPPGFSEFPQIQKGFNNIVKGAASGKWKQLTMKEATVNGLIAVEVACWFFVGECIGKGSLVGYAIPGATHYEVVI